MHRRRGLARARVLAPLAAICSLWGPRTACAEWWIAGEEPRTLIDLGADLSGLSDPTVWRVVGPLELVADDLTGRQAATCTKATLSLLTAQPIEGEYDLHVLLRLTGTRPAATVEVGASGEDPQLTAGYSLRLSSQRGSPYQVVLTPSAAGRPFWLELSNPGRWQSIMYQLRRYPEISPVWDARFRVEVERDMGRLPDWEHRVFDVRFEVRTERLGIWVDDRLVGEKLNPGATGGHVKIGLTPGARLVSCRVERAVPVSDQFVPLQLDGLCNACACGTDGSQGGLGLVGSSLPPPDRLVRVGQVPFVFPHRGDGVDDHVDVGRSLFRYRNTVGEDTLLQRWPDPFVLDPARIRLRVPTWPYARLWLVAAADGEPNSVPVVTARFYKPRAGFAVDAVGTVPDLTAASGLGDARELPVSLLDRGQKREGRLWLIGIPLDAAALASQFRGYRYLDLELTKAVQLTRDYPDPSWYDSLPAGLPSAARIFAMTLEKSPVAMIAGSTRAGNVFVRPELPTWQIQVSNLTPQAVSGQAVVTVLDPYGGKSETTVAVQVGPRAQQRLDVPLKPTVNGWHRVRVNLEAGGAQLAREGTFVQLPPDTRRTRPADSPWGLWWWRGGHDTLQDLEQALYVIHAVGARWALDHSMERRPHHDLMKAWGIQPSYAYAIHGPAPWAYQDPYDQAEYEKLRETTGQAVAAAMAAVPEQVHFTIFAENAISRDLTYGILPEYCGEGEYQLNEQEQRQLRARMITAQAVAEGVRKYAPKAKLLFGSGEPIFSVPFMRAGISKDVFDGIAVDIGVFERPPEQPIRAVTLSRLWMLRQEMKRLGYDDKPLYFTEAIYIPTHPAAVTEELQAAYWVRYATLGMANGVVKLLGTFGLCDSGDYWGSQHYGQGAMLRREPEFNPKPSCAAYATMTRVLDGARFDGWLPTGSLSAYCVRFKAPTGYVYCAWTYHGQRPATVTVPKVQLLTLTDQHGNDSQVALRDDQATITLTSTPVWVRSPQPVTEVRVGDPEYREGPGPHRVLLDDFETDRWHYDPARDEGYETNHFEAKRYLGTLRVGYEKSAERGSRVLSVALQKPDKERLLGVWYGLLLPRAPLDIPGKARALGVWVNGNSSWGRIIYELTDAKGEKWTSIGAREAWNCDDIHCWSFFNFDGWRYVEFPLPSHAPGDNFRELESTWWKFDGEGVVDLPLRLSKVIVEMRTHTFYVNDYLPIDNMQVQFDDLLAVYEDARNMTNAPIAEQRAAAGLLDVAPAGDWLPNPIARLRETGSGAATAIERVYPPAQYYDGTRINVVIRPVEGAKEYRIWVSAYEDGRGAKVLGTSQSVEHLLRGLRPEVPLYLFVSYLDANGQESKPSAAYRILLRDDFPMQ